MIDNYKIGNQISLLRREKGLTGEKFAEALSVSPQAVSKWENGKNLPETALLPAISKLLGASIDSILMPQNLFIIKAVYTDGDSMMVVTKESNRMVEGDSLDLTVAPPFGGLSHDSPKLCVLTVKYQTPDGIFYSFGKQNEHIKISLDSPCFSADKPFQIIGAYYGQGADARDVMQKIDHYDYFRWNEIHVNHETFPSEPGADGTDYLTLVYLNSEGIHVVSCPEGGVLTYNAEHTALSIKDTSSCVLPGIKPLAWGKQLDCCFGGAVTRALNYMGEPYTYEQIMGMSGACYRINFTDVWDWSATDALVAYGYDAPLLRVIGYEAVWADRLEAKDRAAERRNIVSDIQMGRPVVAINLREAPEWGVITGYGDNGRTLYCRTYFDIDVPGFDVDSSSTEYLLAYNWPWGIMHLRKKSPCDNKAPMTAEEILRQSLQTAISSFEASPERGYWQGEQAYEHWIAGLINDALWNRDTMRDDFDRRASVNECTLRNLIDERRCAAVYLRENSLTELAELYRRISETARDFRAEWLDKWDKVSPDGHEWREIEVRLLQEALDMERQAVTLAKERIK